MCTSIRQVLNKVLPRIYYQTELNGSIGRHTGQGWHKTTTLCPFHNDKRHGTFHVNVNTGKYKCFSCGASGDFIDFHRNKYGFDLKTALKDLRRKF